MKSNAKAKSFHVAVRGSFPAARDLAEPNTYTTPRRERSINQSMNNRQSIIGNPSTESSTINDQRTTNRPDFMGSYDPTRRSFGAAIVSASRLRSGQDTSRDSRSNEPDQVAVVLPAAL
jgi:hypothetical protein